MRTLVIAEKPSAGRDIASVLGCRKAGDGYLENERYIVTWAVGHLIGLKFPEEIDLAYKEWSLSYLPFKFEFSKQIYKVPPSTEKQFMTIKALINRSDVEMLINAGDAGREGLLIQRLIYWMAGNRKPVKVLWASSLTEEALRKAFNNLHDDKEFDPLYQEALARQLSDYYMGMSYSRALTISIGKRETTLPYGRCQTPLLNLMAIREKEIRDFVPAPYFELYARFEDGTEAIMTDGEGAVKLKSKEEAESLKSELPANGTVKEYKAETKTEKAPALFSLADLQKHCGAKFGMSPEKVLAAAQSLYEAKLTTYPRTDSNVIPTDIWREIGRHIKAVNFGIFKVPAEETVIPPTADKKYVNDGKVTDHYAIIPTDNSHSAEAYEKLSEDIKKVYEEIVIRFLCIFLPPYEYESSKVTAAIGNRIFSAQGKHTIAEGYKKYMKEKSEDKEIPEYREGQELNEITFFITDKVTKAPSRYTVSSVISLMEKYDIGTSATRAELLIKLEKSGFIKKVKNSYSVSETGEKYISLLPDFLKSPELTHEFEKELKEIEEKKGRAETFVDTVINRQKETIERLKMSDSEDSFSLPEKSKYICPVCGKPVRENERSVFCSGYKEGCKFSVWKTVAGKHLTENQIESLIVKGKTTKIKGFKSKSGKSFEAVLILDKSTGKISFDF